MEAGKDLEQGIEASGAATSAAGRAWSRPMARVIQTVGAITQQSQTTHFDHTAATDTNVTRHIS